ncbi:MAG TPA: N-methyl-D-aspartate receptor NMDAR2C subunit [Phycisphaerae bacterium]|nr:N-methyl-D-aspartate receptor NMDAR2C subunit [Phycisphaerae bacterium]HRW51683.1 N-methyl-D-aspartate receptor NMDAR2C subunit [Phycisphaerae bacterium]
MRERWNQLCERIGIPAVDGAAIYGCIDALYRHPPRAYHSLRHVESMLVDFEAVTDGAEAPERVALAIWFHDCVYVPQLADNEARSADVADLLLRSWLGSEDRDALRALILATRHDSGAETPDERLLVDLDLAILAGGPTTYDAYARAIRQEYAAVPEADYAAGRAAVLDAFLSREAIYSTPRFRREREAPARANLRRELDALSL